MSSDGNDFGEFDNEAAMETLSQVSCNLPTPLGLRPAKRRRLSPSDDDSIEDFIVHEDSDREAASRSRSRSRISADWDSDDEGLKPKSTRKRRSAAGSVKGEVIDAGASKEKKKSKYRIHIPRDHNLPEPQFEYATQVPDVLEDPDSSPYRIRGAQWKFKKPEKPPSQPQSAFSAKSISVSRSANMPTRNGSISNFFPRSANSGAAPKQDAEASDERSRYKPQVDNLIANAEDDFPERLPIPRPVDISQELADLPSDAFSSSPEIELLDSHPRPNSTFALANPSQAQYHTQQRLLAPQNGLRQTTLFGGQATEAERPASQVNKVYNYLKDVGPEEPTHHELDLDALKTWVYPTNLGTIREYQYSIVSNGLFNNLLVALPTGLGKTFIAATIMLNYFRWTKSSQIVFMAPTKPLVAQQIDACFNIAGIPRSATTLLTGEVTPAIRAEEWKTKRVFFMTPQTLENDLRRGYANPKRIVLLVVDEAHRATGNYSYVKVVSLMRSFSKSFRILALTATPGASVEAVQEVISGLEIAKVEIRMEESIDIQQFVHTRNIEKLELEPSDEMIMIEDLLSKALQPLVNLLCGQNGYYNKDPMALTAYGMQKAQKAWFMSTAGRTANPGLKGMMMGLFSILSSVAHGIKLLKFHGIGPFYETMKEFRTGVEDKGARGSKYKKQVTDSPDFQKMMDRIRVWINKEDFVGHPKLTILCESILNHFMDGGEGTQGASGSPSSTRVIVFCEYRDSAEEICRVLRRHKPMIRPSVFVGQQDSKRSQGMNQTKQSETIQNFKDGVFNVLVATSIGEEGLDIGQVDLIVCYDASGSPIRMLQRMGRTGRKRAGKIVLLVMKGKESDSFEKAKDNYEQMQKLICDGKRFTFHHDLSTRIVPRDVKPVVDKRVVEIPLENTQDGSLPEPRRKRAARGTKMPAKKFHVPDGVELGIVKASSLFGSSKNSENSAVKLNPELLPEQLMTPPDPSSVILSPHDQSELARVYQSVYGNGKLEVETPDLKLHPAAQRIPRPVGFIRHGSRTKAFVRTMKSMHNMTLERTRTWQRTYEQNGLESFPLLSPFSSPDHSQGGVASDLEPELLRKRKPAKAKAKTTHKRMKINRSFSDGESVDKDEDNLSLYDDQEDDDDDLEGFLVKDTEIIQEHIPEDSLSSQTSTLPSPRNLTKLTPFFEPSTFIDTDESDSGDEELPDIGRLSSSASKPKSTSLSSVNAYKDGPKTITEKPQQRRRLVKRSAKSHSSDVND